MNKLFSFLFSAMERVKKLLPAKSSTPNETLLKLLSSELKLSLYVSGGCSSILGWLTLFPGSSKVVAETRNPYARSAIINTLGYEPSTYVGSEVSRDFALKAFTNTQRYLYSDSEDDLHFRQERILGVGITGALKSNYMRKGKHHAFVSLVDQKKYITYYILLDKDQRTREEEDYFIGYNVLNIINNPLTENPVLIGNVLANDQITVVETKPTIDLLLSQLSSSIMNIVFLPGGKILVDQIVKKCVILPGSFNPVHEGHVTLGEVAARKCGVDKSNVIFELSALNADKGLIAKEEIEKRVEMIVDRGFGAMITHKPFFYAKNDYLKEGFFVVGADTYKRIVNTKYYNNSRDIMISKLSEFEKNKNTLVVAPRLNSETNKVETLKDFEIPDVLKPFVSELEHFRRDVSSTEIRKKLQEKERNENNNFYHFSEQKC